MIYPCIDLMDGMIVQLVQGKRENKKIGTTDFEAQIYKFKPFGAIQLIDLDAAMDEGNNYILIKEIIKRIRCRVGGGIRTIKKAEELIKLEADKIIIGSSAFKEGKIDFDFLKKLNEKIKKEKIIIAIDTMKEEIVVHGWKQKTGINVFDAVKNLEPYCSEFLATYVDKEGMLEGTNIEFFKKLKVLTKNEITAAGGITTLDEVRALQNADINSALGMAIYTGKINLKDLLKI
jgi:phosphoribosylformimino-5-aminoimidazole carboxamide ribotide isomerase